MNKKTLFLHTYALGSAERYVHHYFRQQAGHSKRSHIYPRAQFDYYSQGYNHEYIFEGLYNANFHQSSSVQEYYKTFIKRIWKSIIDDMESADVVIFSILARANLWDMFWDVVKTYDRIKKVTIIPVITLCSQEDSYEQLARNIAWGSVDTTPPLTSILYQYAESIDALYGGAKNAGIEVAPAHIHWQNGEHAEAQAATLEFVRSSTGLSAVPDGWNPPRFLRGYTSLRFAVLTNLFPAPQWVNTLGLAPRYMQNVHSSVLEQNLMVALQRVEDEGILSITPCSSASMRKDVHILGARGNAELCLRYPHLATPIATPPLWGCDIAGAEWLPLSTHEIDACLDAFTQEQIRDLRYRLQEKFIELTDEQARILDRIQTRPHMFTRQAAPAYTVSVLTLAYQQEKYIGECIESVLAQKSDFPVQHIIVDDASDDGTQDIIDNYACTYKNIRPFYLAKQGSGNVKALFERCKTPFAALCDGDDYYTDPEKLQLQVDHLSSNMDLALTFHPVSVVYEDNEYNNGVYPLVENLPRGEKPWYYLADLFKGNFIQTNSVMYRWRFQDGVPDWFVWDLVPGDWVWHLLHAECGNIGFINRIMSTYRRHSDSLFATSLAKQSSVAHRVVHGMRELRTYEFVNTYFKGKYSHTLKKLSAGVFVDFFMHGWATGDMVLFESACDRYSDFAKYFFQELKTVKKSSTDPA